MSDMPLWRSLAEDDPPEVHDARKRIRDALEAVLEPVAAALRRHGEQERRRRDRFLALEEKKLALRRKLILRKRRRARLSRSASSGKSLRLRFHHQLCLKFPHQ